MSTPARIFRHPIHPMLVTLPIGLWIFAFVCDMLFLLRQIPVMNLVAFYAYLGGWIGALLAAVPGLMDYLAIKEKMPRRIATYHMVLNFILIVLMGINLALRVYAPGWDAFAYLVSGVAIMVLLVSGWLGGELVHVYGVSLDPERGKGRLGTEMASDVPPASRRGRSPQPR